MVEKEIQDGDVHVLLTNRTGAYALFSGKPASRYEGVFFRQNNRMVKVIESLVFKNPVTTITNRLSSVVLNRGELVQTLFMPLWHDALVMGLSEETEFELVLDVKIGDDHRVWGRNYEMLKEDHTLLIKFSKKNDARDDNALFSDEFEVYLAVYAPKLEYIPLLQWEEHAYAYDEYRHSPPFTRWVFKACKLRAQDVVFAWGSKKQDAIKTAKDVFDARDRLKREREHYVHELVAQVPKGVEKDVRLACQCAVNALDSLIVRDEFVCAGLPWFYQQWARDEIICAKALLIMKKYDFVKKALVSYLSRITREGLLPNMIDRDSSLLALDAVGWLLVRLNDLLDTVAKKRIELISRREKQHMADAVQQVWSRLVQHRLKDGLFESRQNETWMDTEFGGDTRIGFPIEVQALLLAGSKIVKRLGGKSDLHVADVMAAVRKKFLKNNLLLDVIGQSVIRPNVFIVAYVFPELLSKKEWEQCFDAVLPRLWLNWGGLSSIDKKHQLFTETYTGEDNKSYHRGDSWFWLNNLAAIVLHRLNHRKFEKYINKILEASTNEILYKGATGFAGEVSSAKELSSHGCVAQAWSAALYIELVQELFAK